MEGNAIDVAERLVDEDDRSVEAWYLGGYGKYMLGGKLRGKSRLSDAESWQKLWRSSRKWLAQCLRIYDLEEYEDERLQEHTKELLESIKNELGELAEGDDEIWEDTDDDDDNDDGKNDDSDEDMQ
jgi:hypothetical protein